MARVLVAVVMLLLMACGVVAGLTIMEVGPFKKFAVYLPKPAPAPKPRVPEFSYVTMDPMSFPVFRGPDQPVGQLVLALTIEVKYGAKPKVDAIMTRLHSAILLDLFEFLPHHMEGRDLPDLDTLKKRVKHTADKVAGPDLVTSILVKSAYER